MPSCTEILDSILTRTKRDYHSGHPLYSYKISEGELDQLRQELKNRIHLSGTFDTYEECAAFCLFSAEWFRRHYEQGVWSWDVIFRGLDCDARQSHSLKPRVGDYTIYGLQWWCVDVIKTELSHRYLTTLVCQGGFPLNTLRNEVAGISRFLKVCLRDHERYPTEPLSEVIASHIHYLPVTLDNAGLRGLAEDLVGVIADLRKRSDAASDVETSRVEYLDANEAGWSQNLPLRIEEQEAKELLLSLLDAVSAPRADSSKFSVTTTLDIRGTDARIVRQLHFPRSLSEPDFRRLLEFKDEHDIVPRMTGFLRAGEIRNSCVNISRSYDGATFRLNKLENTTLSGPEAYQATTLVLTAGRQERDPIALSGGESLPDSPWIFTDEQPHQLIGVGSLNPRDATVLIALPKGSSAPPTDDSDLEPLEATVAGREIIRFSGMIDIIWEDNTFRVKTKSESQNDFLYELRGRKRHLGTGGSTYWCGAPTIVEIPVLDDGPFRQLSDEHVQWRPRAGGSWRTGLKNCLGDVMVRVQEEEITKFLTRATILPDGFVLSVRPGKSPGTGELVLEGIDNVQIYPVATAAVNAEVVHEHDCHRINVQTGDERPSLIHARLRFDNGNDSEVAFVCPTKSIGLIDVTGKRVPEEHGVTLDRMDGLTLQVIQPDGRRPHIYFSRENDQLIDSARESRIQGVWELPLSYIRSTAKEFLSLSDDPDSEVEFSVRFGAAIRPDFTWRVSRYGRSLAKAQLFLLDSERDRYTDFSLDNPTGKSDEDDDVRLIATPLGHPNEEVDAESISSIVPGRWRIDHSHYSPGYYLAIARHSQGECLRPMRFVVRPAEILRDSAEEVPAENAFDHVLNIHGKEGRIHAWDEFFHQLVRDFGHPGWARVDELVEASERLPITTFEAVSALTRNPSAVAHYGCRFPNDAQLWQRFEELPFLWSLIPVQAWIATMSRYQAHLQTTLERAEIEATHIGKILEENLDKFVSEAPDRIPSMACVVLSMLQTGMAVDLSKLESHGVKYQPRAAQQQRSADQLRLLKRHEQFDTRNSWPYFRIDSNDEVRSIFTTTEGLEITDSFPNQWPVLNGPAIAAVHSVYNVPTTLDQVRQFKRLRATDVDWYDRANVIAMAMLLDRRVKEDSSCFQTVSEETH